jgi:N4-gp56 family major capsid protein
MSYTWDFDTPTGVFKNRELSAKLYENALQNSVAMRYVDVQNEFGKNKGESLTFTRFTHITEPASAALSENQPIPEVQFSLATSSFTVTEYGVAVPFTGKLEALAKFNIQNIVQRTLQEQKRLVLDSLALTNFKLAAVKYVPTANTAATITTNGTPSGTAQAALTFWHVEDISRYLFDDRNVPFFNDETYIGIFRGKTLTELRRDSAFVQWNQYTNVGKKAKGEVGTIERIKFVETNHSHANALPDVGSNSFGMGVVFGQDAVGMIEAEAPHLRAALPSGHGRFRSIAWYALLGFNIIFSAGTVGNARIAHITSA